MSFIGYREWGRIRLPPSRVPIMTKRPTSAKVTSVAESDPMPWDVADAKFCLAIGRFVVAFSQLEFSLRFALGAALQLTDEQFDAVTAAYDFSALCRVTKAVYLVKNAGNDVRCRAIEELMNRCLGLHENARNPIMHATWSLADTGRAARHVSRQKHKVSYPFTTPEQVAEQTDHVMRANTDVFVVCGGMKSA